MGTQTETKTEKNPFKNKDIRVVHHGEKIILPSSPRTMKTEEAIEALERIHEQEKQKVTIHEEAEAFPLEGAWALQKVLERKFGYTLNKSKEGFFGQEIPPTLVSLEVGVGQQDQVIWGRFMVPGLKAQLETGVSMKKGRMIFAIKGVAPKGEQQQIKEIADEVREFVAKYSLYRGQAIKVTTVWDEKAEKYTMDVSEPPSFIDLSKVNPNEMVFSSDVMSQIETTIFTPIRNTEICRQHKIPLKRSALLEGPFGTGKTLCAFVAATLAVKNDWTFIYLDRVAALHDVLVFARQYAPVVVFCEDIDRAFDGDSRTIEIDDILNNMDGLDSKGHEVMCIFTSNDVNVISPAMLRPGRLDAVIHVAPPDAKAAEKLIRIYGRDLIADTEDLTAAGAALQGQIPAFIREAVERAKLYAISRLKAPTDPLRLQGDDVRLAADGMKKHLSLVNPKKQVMPPSEILARTLAHAVKSYAEEPLPEVQMQ